MKTQQYVNGVSIPIYWASNWVWDFFCFSIPIISVIAVLEIFDVELLTSDLTLGPTLTLMIL